MKKVKSTPKKKTIKKASIPKKRVSNRKYPPKKCEKVDCTIMFIPTSKKQKYCCRQHQIDQNNDNRNQKEAPGRMLEKIYRHNEQILKKLKEACERLNKSVISLDYLDIENYYHGYNTDTTINSQTGKTVGWSYHYGLEGFNKEKQQFIIHYRQNYQI